MDTLEIIKKRVEELNKVTTGHTANQLLNKAAALLKINKKIHATTSSLVLVASYLALAVDKSRIDEKAFVTNTKNRQLPDYFNNVVNLNMTKSIVEEDLIIDSKRIQDIDCEMEQLLNELNKLEQEKQIIKSQFSIKSQLLKALNK